MRPKETNKVLKTDLREMEIYIVRQRIQNNVLKRFSELQEYTMTKWNWKTMHRPNKFSKEAKNHQKQRNQS